MQRSKTIARVSFDHPSPTAWWYTNLIVFLCLVWCTKKNCMKMSANILAWRLWANHVLVSSIERLSQWVWEPLSERALFWLTSHFVRRFLTHLCQVTASCEKKKGENGVSDQTTDGAFPGCLYRVWPSRPDPRDPDLRQSVGLPQPNWHGAPQKKCAIRRIRYPTLTNAFFKASFHFLSALFLTLPSVSNPCFLP